MNPEPKEFDATYQALVNGRASDAARAIVEHREHQFPNPTEGHRRLGLIWTGLLEQHYQTKFEAPIPAHVVMAMLLGLKLGRLCLDPTNRDTRLDVHGYATLLTDALEAADGTPSAEDAIATEAVSAPPVSPLTLNEVRERLGLPPIAADGTESSWSDDQLAIAAASEPNVKATIEERMPQHANCREPGGIDEMLRRQAQAKYHLPEEEPE